MKTAILLAAALISHGGGLDGNGGHTNRKTGVYHCHRCPCGCDEQTNKAIEPSTPMRDRPKSGGSPAPSSSQDSESRSVKIKRAVDGDTLETEAGEKIRLIGVDTPETVHPSKPVECFGKEASKFTSEAVAGKTVTLTFDQQRKDKYERTLAYVKLPDGKMLNEEIIRQGYGHAYTKYPFKQEFMDKFREAEREARDNQRGLWGSACDDD